jgi:hypothetical protein
LRVWLALSAAEAPLPLAVMAQAATRIVRAVPTVVLLQALGLAVPQLLEQWPVAALQWRLEWTPPPVAQVAARRSVRGQG